MAETLKDVIQRMKDQKNPQAKPIEVVKPVKQEIPEDDEDDDDEMEIPEETEAEVPKSTLNDKQIAKIIQEIEMLQNDGRFRAELLHQFQELNQAMVTIAGILVEMNGKK